MREGTAVGDDYGLFEESAVREFEDPERVQRHRSHVRQAYQTAHASVGPFLDNATSNDELVSRLALVRPDVDQLLFPFQLTAEDHEAVVRHLAKPDPGGPAAIAKDFTTEPAQSPGIDVPWDPEDIPAQADGSDEKNDATLEHISKKKTILAANEFPWVWDRDANCFKSSNTSTFGCSCGRQAFSGVGQHRCVCGKVWNISSIANGAKQAMDAPSYACREVHTDDRLMLAATARCDCGAQGDELHDADCASYSGTNCSECGAQSGELHDAQCPNAGHKSSRRKLGDGSNNADGHDPAKGGTGGNEDLPQPELEMNPDDPSYVEPSKKAANLIRHLYADTGLWPMVSDKDLQANWKTLMGIVTDPTQVSVLEHGGYQDLIAELYQEIGRRGLSTPQPDQNSSMMPEPQPQMGVQPQQQFPSPSALASKQGFVGWVLSLNKRLSVDVKDEYANRTTEYDGSEPPIPGIPIARDDLEEGPEDNDPTDSQRSDFAQDTDDRNEIGQSDPRKDNHPEDLKPETETHT